MRHSWILMTLFAAACGSGTPPSPSPGPGSGTGESITGRERIGWDQQADDTAELAAFRYAIYVDGARGELADASCASSAGPSGFACSGRLPAMSSGAHTLELAALTADAVESARSSSLRVIVTAALAGADVAEWQSGRIETTSDGITLRLDGLAGGLDRPVDAAFVPDGRLFIVERGGRIRIVADGALERRDALVLTEGDERQAALSIAVDPDFARTHFVFVVHTADTAAGPVVRLSRYRELRGVLAERAVLFESPGEAAADASAVARFGPDGKLYVAVSGEGLAGRLYRLSPDGTLPRDQAGSSLAIAAGLVGARGLGWDPRSGVLWIADDAAGRAHLSGLSMSAPPVRAIIRGRRAVAPGIGSLAFYGSEALPGLRGDALIASAEGYILRLRFADDDATRVARSERLLDHVAGPIRVVSIGPDGAIYFCTDTALGRLTAVP